VVYRGRYPITALVVGPEGEEVHCDELGRIKVQIQGLDPDDHTHAQGVGASGTDRDSAYVRVSTSLAGQSFGHTSLPRVGMEVSLDFLNGDPDKMFVTGVLHNGPNKPAAFSHTGSLPGNRYVSGIKTKEIKAARYNQLRFDDTPGQVSGQLAIEHAYSQLNLGYLTQPRDNGQGQDRGGETCRRRSWFLPRRRETKAGAKRETGIFTLTARPLQLTVCP
jgi:type VI secretion system secreted protein VgrG